MITASHNTKNRKNNCQKTGRLNRFTLRSMYGPFAWLLCKGVVCWFCLLFPMLSLCQPLTMSSSAALAEKIYLQLDSRFYTNDQTIWFKAIVANAINHAPAQLSGVLYVELIDGSSTITERKIVRLSGSIGSGFFSLTKNNSPGVYQIRAYTEWNKNFGSAFIFQEYIQVFSSSSSFSPSSITEVKIEKKTQNDRWLNVRFDPLSIDSLAGKDLTVLLTDGEKKDSVILKRNKGEYTLHYPLVQGAQFVTLNLRTDNGVKYAKTIVLDTAYLDVAVFPESGEMVHGLPALLGIKLLGYNGLGKAAGGEIINRKGETIGAFQTNSLGMGKVLLPLVDSQECYTVKVTTAGGSPTNKTYTLPAIARRGNTLSIRKEGENIWINVRSNYLLEDSVLVRATCRGVLYFDVKGRMKNGDLRFSLPASAFPEGIIDFTLFQDSLHPLAERLYYNLRAEGRIQLALGSDKAAYVQREQTTVKIQTKNSEGLPVPASASVLVISGTDGDPSLITRGNILSYFLLASDLKGRIENPGYYFRGDTVANDDLDALLLTQGWRKYKYTRDTAKLLWSPEPGLAVSGRVTGGLFSQKAKKEAELTLMTFGEKPSVQSATTDSNGRFHFNLPDEYGERLKVLIQSANKSHKAKDYTVSLDKKESPPVVFEPVNAVQLPDSIVDAYVQMSRTRKKAEDAARRAREGGTLEEVVIKTYAMTPERKAVADLYGKPRVVIEGDEIRAKEEKWSYGLYSVLLFNYPDKINIVRAGDGTLYARLYNREPTLVVVDGIPVKFYEYGHIASIPPSEVKSFEIIEYAKNFRNLYCEANPQGCGPGAPVTGNVIAIYTFGRKGIHGTNPAIGITSMEVPLFSPTREFYAPKYETLTPAEWQRPDLRSLVHWEPNLRLDSTGKGEVFFYNADITGTTCVIVEVISETGELGYGLLRYGVKKKVE